MAKRFALVWALFVVAALAASAGDVAQFVNLGFSPDSRYFMFGQYGTLERNSAAWAVSAGVPRISSPMHTVVSAASTPRSGQLILLLESPLFDLRARKEFGFAGILHSDTPKHLLDDHFDVLIVNGNALLLCHEARKVHGKTVGIVEFEGIFTGNGGTAR